MTILVKPVVLAIDPSSTCTGYALATGLDPAELIEAGRIQASDRRVDGKDAVGDWLNRKELASMRRILSIIPDLDDVVNRYHPTQIVVETPSGKCGTGSKHGAKGSLTTYGMAAGVIVHACMRWCPWTFPVTERQWTSRSGGKESRQLAIKLLYPNQYDPKRDPGGDVSDAVSLLRWWIEGGFGCDRRSSTIRSERSTR